MSPRKARHWPVEPTPLAGEVIDNHTHLPTGEWQIPSADGTRLSLSEQLERAGRVGVVAQITSACELPEFEPSLQLARQYPSVAVALAIHPNEAALHAGHAEPSPDGLTPEIRDHHIPLVDALTEVERHLKDPHVVAVGESGLDFYRTAHEGREAQAESFRAHLELARHADLPLQIHDREAHAEVIEILEESAHREQGIVFHCFSGDRQMADILAKKHWYASFAGPLTYPANEHLRQALRALPRELVLVETDAPYLTPVPERGNPNASYVMAHTVRAIAQLWDASEEETCEQLMVNTRRLYGQEF